MKITLNLAVLFCIHASANDEWVKSPKTRALPGQESIKGSTYFGKRFIKIKGNYAAVFESVLDKRDSISGEFILGKFRYLYESPIGDGSRFAPLHDESITTVIMNCKEKFFGTKSIAYLNKGKVQHVEETPENEILMMQQKVGASTVNDLCDFYEKRSRLP